MGYCLASLLDFKGLESISAGLERLILFLYPTFVILLTGLLYRRPIAGIQRVALVLSYAGTGLVYSAQPMTASLNVARVHCWYLTAPLPSPSNLTASGHYIPRFGSRRFTAYSMSVACGVTIIHFLFSKPLGQLVVPPDVLALALLSTVLPAFLMNAGIRRIGTD